MAEGYVYILINPSLRLNRYKIGMTTKSPAERALDMSTATGVPEPFEVAYARKVRDCQWAEREIKNRLEDKRISTNREFYDIALQDAVDILKSVADEIDGITVGRGSQDSIARAEGWKVAAWETPDVREAIEVDFDVHIPPANVRRQGRSGDSKKSGRKTIEEHLSVCHPNIRDVFEEFRAKVKEIDPYVQENSWSYGVAYRARQNFVEMYFRTNRLEVCLRPRKYHDPEGLLGKVPDSYKWTLNRRFLLEDKNQIAYLISLVRQSWEDVR
jgi:predicted transport protein